ncbi:MAG: 4Fe-4S binding protein [Persephonella sp.]|nr:4Fe-4S binding protein [Persephonella sp.]
MNRLRFNFSECVHVYYKDSSCNLCVKVCPVEGAVIQKDYRVSVNSKKCVSCGACVGACPSEAFSLSGFDVDALFKTLKEEPLLSCKKNLPCLSTLSVEDIVTAVINGGSDVVFDTGQCKDCFIGTLLEEINKKVDEANYILEKLGVENRAIIEDLKAAPEEKTENRRRSFLKNFGKAAAGLTFWALMPGFLL